MASPPYIETLVNNSLLGKKSGEGFYRFKDEDDRRGEPNPRLHDLLGLDAVHIAVPNKQEIEDRLILGIVNEAVRALDEGLIVPPPGTENPTEFSAKMIDLATVLGFGFAGHEGGVLRYAESLGAEEVYRRLSKLSEKCGERFIPCEGIKARAEGGIGFYQSI